MKSGSRRNRDVGRRQSGTHRHQRTSMKSGSRRNRDDPARRTRGGTATRDLMDPYVLAQNQPQ